ncbi:MFS transporter [Novosphingobium sp. PS1R-30]|uniref:MFS transporter n=1 Tax=Novosphingobium anseongense TaxID=3133436 RepID=A0ABU8S1G0_9SPHN
MRNFGEFRQHWRPLTASFLGMGSALSLNSYILSTFAPYMIGEFGWSRAQWAMLGIVQGVMIVCLPLAGRLTDLYGVRRVAATGALTFPLFLVAISMMNGDLHVYLAIYVAQTIVGATTTATVYARVVAEAFTLRRGLALAIAGSSPPLVAAIGSPLVTAFVDSHGWRAGYLAVAIYCAICAVATIALLPRGRPRGVRLEAGVQRRAGVYRAISAMPVFWMLLLACFLVNLPFTLAISQIKLVVLDQGISDADAAIMISAFAIGSIVGRFIAGFALDVIAGHIVAAIGFGLPFIGLMLLASSYDTVPVVGLAILLMGLSFGSEGDVIPFLITRYFDMAIFSTVMGLLSAAIGLAMAMGNVILSASLTATDSFDLYLFIAAAGSFLGSGIFLALGLRRFRPAGA